MWDWQRDREEDEVEIVQNPYETGYNYYGEKVHTIVSKVTKLILTILHF